MPSLETLNAENLPLREKQTVALASVLAAALLTALKFSVGIATGSLGILSDGAHSGLDLIAAGVTYFSVRVADKPADTTHPFGHGKVEHLSAFIETALLLVTCAWIAFEAGRRLFFHEVHVNPSVWAFGVMAVSIVVDTFRSRSLSRVAKKYNSQALEADALHFSTDVYSSSVVILGLLLVLISDRWHITWLELADPVAALAVAGIVISISVRLGRKTVDALVDAAPEGAAASIREAVSKVQGVLQEDRIRVRQSGSRLFVDLRVTLESNIPLEHAQSVMDLVDARVRDLFPAADVVIHATPREPPAGDMVEKVRAVANRQNFRVHEVTVYEVNGRINVNLDLEVEPELKINAAHTQADSLERLIQAELPEVDQVHVHLEPLLREVASADSAPLDQDAVERKLMSIARETPGLEDCHSVEALLVGGAILVNLHCTVEADLPISQVHDITEDLEFRFREAFPQISKVSVHAEPASGK
ncbi:MAG TPA: cation diffusion facilitator family transporter [Candidatus Dormibacteraeota bacterium]|nr:cation diffusion facilitator family transporter [Terriglobia bacterium]HVC00144.1 cation diffusion facilitator family transporter [Candidatus Dormibacteraeota bacterium]